MASSQRSKKTIKEILQKSAGQLEPAELDDLLALSLKKSKEYIYKNPDKKIGPAAVRAFYKLIKKRQDNWSLAYLKGYREFYGLKFLVSKNTLVPRPESELIVEEALKNIKKENSILDIGTGSGCLILSIAKNNPKTSSYTAVDISDKALKTARTNARKLGLSKKIKFLKSNLLKNIKAQKFDIIIANLPYLTPEQLKEKSIKKEPKIALLSGKDGLDHYRKMFGQINTYLAKKYLVLIEIDPQQKKAIEEIISENMPLVKIKFIKDLAGHFRVAKITN
ncbi:peptide chain release factor N(5)-glutamine methyltransferase [Patescibacteria group bacterium]|nr:peptide chain release factor N(5)-glutamine methyltransferase [Patescibacteria group bacterium]